MKPFKLFVLGMTAVLISVLIGEYASWLIHNSLIKISTERLIIDPFVAAFEIEFLFRPILTGLIAAFSFLVGWCFTIRRIRIPDKKASKVLFFSMLVSTILSLIYAYIEWMLLWPSLRQPP